MTVHADTTEIRTALTALGIEQQRVAQLFGVDPRSVRRWQRGERRPPLGIGVILRLLAVGALTAEQIAAAATPNGNGRAAAPIPATNGASVPAASATTAEQIWKLTSISCRWPIGDPSHGDFRFCGCQTTEPPYCTEHRAAAYLPSTARTTRC
jgi:transcriptional regulator with XRE-family HTH domain